MFNSNFVEILITTEYITLGAFLKFSGIVAQGSEVKTFLLENCVFVNDELERRRGRKLFPKTIVQVNNSIYQITKHN